MSLPSIALHMTLHTQDFKGQGHRQGKISITPRPCTLASPDYPYQESTSYTLKVSQDLARSRV